MKFTLGFLTGMTAVIFAVIAIIASIAAFIAGLALGWKAFGENDDEMPTTNHEGTPS